MSEILRLAKLLKKGDHIRYGDVGWEIIAIEDYDDEILCLTLNNFSAIKPLKILLFKEDLVPLSYMTVLLNS